MSSTHSLSDLLSIKSIESNDSYKTYCYKCNVCDLTFPLEQLKTHMKAHIKSSFVCNQSDESFRSRGGFDNHMVAHRGEKIHTCIHCDKTFILAGRLKNHLKTFHGLDLAVDTSMVCNQCDKSFSRRFGFNYHMKAHSRGNTHTCSQCDKAFIKRKQMNIHIQTVHGLVINNKVCNQCNKYFNSRGGFDYHMKAHSGEKSYTCSQCDKAFINAGQLKKHIKSVHELKTQYKCIECDQEFSQSGNLKTHIRGKPNDHRLFKCKQCYKSFNEAKWLDRHICKIIFSKLETEADEGEIHNTLEEGQLSN